MSAERLRVAADAIRDQWTHREDPGTTWHQQVVFYLGVADWLESEIERAKFRERQQRETNAWLRRGVDPHPCYYDKQTEKAIAVADAYLGGA